ncbi:hypothetical protein EK904_010360 [Melospiza melodia maxima]|nr:hypothetical protein EK904_010360 [Melospiza melodia maxima]
MQPVLWVYNTNLTKFSISVYLNYMFVKLKGYLFIFFHDNLQKMKGMMGYVINSEILQRRCDCREQLMIISFLLKYSHCDSPEAKVEQGSGLDTGMQLMLCRALRVYFIHDLFHRSSLEEEVGLFGAEQNRIPFLLKCFHLGIQLPGWNPCALQLNEKCSLGSNENEKDSWDVCKFCTADRRVFQMKSKPPVEEEKNHLTAVDCSFPAEIQQFPQMPLVITGKKRKKNEN